MRMSLNPKETLARLCYLASDVSPSFLAIPYLELNYCSLSLSGCEEVQVFVELSSFLDEILSHYCIEQMNLTFFLSPSTVSTTHSFVYLNHSFIYNSSLLPTPIFFRLSTRHIHLAVILLLHLE